MSNISMHIYMFSLNWFCLLLAVIPTEIHIPEQGQCFISLLFSCYISGYLHQLQIYVKFYILCIADDGLVRAI